MLMFVGLQEAQTAYEEKLNSSKTGGDKALFKLAWQVKEIQDLLLQVRSLLTEIGAICAKCQDQNCNLIKENVAQKISNIRDRLEDAVKKITKYRRIAASHIFVVMISSEKKKQEALCPTHSVHTDSCTERQTDC